MVHPFLAQSFLTSLVIGQLHINSSLIFSSPKVEQEGKLSLIRHSYWPHGDHQRIDFFDPEYYHYFGISEEDLPQVRMMRNGREVFNPLKKLDFPFTYRPEEF